MKIWRMRIPCWIPKTTNTHLEYVIRIAFSRNICCMSATRCYVMHTLSLLADSQSSLLSLTYSQCGSTSCSHVSRVFNNLVRHNYLLQKPQLQRNYSLITAILRLFTIKYQVIMKSYHYFYFKSILTVFERLHNNILAVTEENCKEEIFS
jgi:hypothetical protein